MGRSSSGVEPEACMVLPIIDEESSETEMGEGSPERKVVVDERRKAIVSRLRDLLRRAAAQSAQSKLRSTMLVSAKKWKRVVVSLQNSRIARKQQEQQLTTNLQSGDGGMSSSPVSSDSSFSWDNAAAESCSSSPAQSPLWPASVRQLSPSPATHAAMRLRPDSSAGSADDRMSMSSGGSPGDDDDDGGSSRTCQWITTDSDFVVLEMQKLRYREIVGIQIKQSSPSI
ncbi:hypothetical protein GUJ93_ZPchr0006g45776 [Zizania palustris]|uniref:Uncharacterized protein n=1 Tax=Zizania palustris TaxID=103762 RepID=A0A8J5SW63_ZIZPA|nr:hypothetical protein GUJ93_ZPchr0006g45776 [Zizania palustris]